MVFPDVLGVLRDLEDKTVPRLPGPTALLQVKPKHPRVHLLKLRRVSNRTNEKQPKFVENENTTPWVLLICIYRTVAVVTVDVFPASHREIKAGFIIIDGA